MPPPVAADHSEHRSMWDRLHFQKIGSWLRKDDDPPSPPLLPSPRPPLPLPPPNAQRPEPPLAAPQDPTRPHSSGGLLGRRASRRVVPGLPRPLTFKRMHSEKRDKLLPVPPNDGPRRAPSSDPREAATATATPTPTDRTLSPPPFSPPSMSAPDVLSPHVSASLHSKPSVLGPTIGGGPDSNIPAGARQVDFTMEDAKDFLSTVAPPPPLDAFDATDSLDAIVSPDAIDSHDGLDSLQAVNSLHPMAATDSMPASKPLENCSPRSSHSARAEVDDIRLQEELEAKWILNLSMHFRDMSDREKFFITYAEESNKWRRVTVSCDYRRLEPDSLESDLKTLYYQRDKSARIYEAIRDSLPDIQFYDTVTNLKLETTDGRLHVHVTEDVNEIIPYPPLSAIQHLGCKRFKETAVNFDSHISGFVYKVCVNNRVYIKKEIPGPDAVDEFLYEINALCSLPESKSVIRFEAIIVDERNELIKGLIISYAEQGALVDIIYDYKPTGQLPWERRERWARQIVEGLSEIHECGFVQGDFTLSNIVIDANDDAKIIDINRRGCPVGWEPPELARLIESGQRISIYIGVKSDLYQLGMVLWALAEQHDEPERQERPLTRTLNRPNTDIPIYFREIIRACLSDQPRDRPSAASLLKRFPTHVGEPQAKKRVALRDSVSTHRSDKEYIDPATAVDLKDISQHRQHSRKQSSFENATEPLMDGPPSSGSYVMASRFVDRSRSPDVPRSRSRNRRSEGSPYTGHRSVLSFDDSELDNELASLPASRETRWEQIYVDGDTQLVQRGGGDIDVQDFEPQEPKEICITTPPDEMGSSLRADQVSDSASLQLPAVAEHKTIETDQLEAKSQESDLKTHDQGVRGVENKASFSDRVQQLAQLQAQQTNADDKPYSSSQRAPKIPDPTTLADIKYDLEKDTSPPSRVSTSFFTFNRMARVSTGFSVAQGHHMPVHQDSGFSELERIPSQDQQIRYSLDESVESLRMDENEIIRSRLWPSKNASLNSCSAVRDATIECTSAMAPNFATSSSLAEPRLQSHVSRAPKSASNLEPAHIPNLDDMQSKSLGGKVSNTTIRPASSQTPDSHHRFPYSTPSHSTHPPLETSDARMFSAPRESPPHPYYDTEVLPDDDEARGLSQDEKKKRRAADDLADYLSHSISFAQQPTEYFSHRQDARKHGAPMANSQEPKV